MRWRSYQLWVLAVIVLYGMTGAVRAQQRYQRDQSDRASHLRPQHREAVEQWLASRKLALRVATVADCSNKEGLGITRKERGKAIILTTRSGISTATGGRISPLLW